LASPVVAIGFVGLGNMGTPMTMRLVAAGHRVIGYDVSEDARRRVGAFGVEEAKSLGDVARDVSQLILMLPDSKAVAAVLSDEELLDRLQPGALVIDMSSSEPLRTRELAARMNERGFRMIDAPVSGGVSGAQTGKLTVMVGGDPADFEEARSSLETLGRFMLAGPVGSGHAVKALNNLMSATHLWITSEAILAGERFGLDADVMLSIFNGSSGRSGSTENKWPNFIRTGTFDTGFGLRLMLKDMRIAVQLSEQVGVPSDLGSDAVVLWSRAADGLAPGADHTEIARWLQGRADDHED
jgi:3-hydroxyisobutyrate dehydrogenase